MHLMGNHTVVFSKKKHNRTRGPEGCFLMKLWILFSS